jgi:hypothetical protein
MFSSGERSYATAKSYRFDGGALPLGFLPLWCAGAWVHVVAYSTCIAKSCTRDTQLIK